MPNRSAQQLEADERWYQLVSKRTGPTAVAMAAALSLWICIETWGNWFAFGVSIALIVITYPVNRLFDLTIGKRLGTKSELIRAIVNAAFCVPAFALMGWPLGTWFWMPYNALTLDGSANPHGFTTVLVCCGLQAVGGIVTGASPETAIGFTVLALAVWRTASVRGALLREMIFEAQHEHREVVIAHAQLQEQIAAREKVELELRQAQKLEAMGRLAAGVAHEINTPMQFVSDHLRFVSESTNELMALAHKLATPEVAAEADLQYLEENVPAALAQAEAGVQRVAAIVRSMKEFAHPGNAERAPVDLNHAIENTLTISRYEYKLVADIETDLGAIPAVPGNATELSQVLLNLIINAAHAIGDVARLSGERGRILIRSALVGPNVEITIRDTGGGMRGSVKMKAFEPFFTTKSVGRGTGQGLAISRAVVERHGGEITFESELGKGTTFVIRLPITARLSGALVPSAA